jgi:hydroxyacylglutathione hydrolase
MAEHQLRLRKRTGASFPYFERMHVNLFLERVHSPGLAHISYIVGDNGKAAVIDPRRDCDVYVEIANQHAARIAHIFETHRNEDYVIGSLELSAMTGADIYHGSELPFAYGNAVTEGDTFDLGDLRVQVLSTPGHTFESISLALADLSISEQPFAVFTGDALFVGDVGRTDFFPNRREETAGLLYDSIFGKILPLGDHVLVFPAHGAGSVCGANLSTREISTCGWERLHNPALQRTDRSEFILYKMAEHHHKPPYFTRMERYNLEGAPPLDRTSRPAPFGAREFEHAIGDGMVAVDTRGPEAFGGAHIPGSIAIPLELIPVYAGWLLSYDQPVGLVVDRLEDVRTAVEYLLRIGYDSVTAYLEGGMRAWQTDGREFEGVRQVHIGEIERRLDQRENFTLLDVRSGSEFRAAHLPRAVNIYLGELPNRLGELPPARPITTFCGSGHRAVIAASLLMRAGLTQVESCLGSMAAWRASGRPVVTEH